MKKVLAVTLLLALLISMTACGDGVAPNSTNVTQDMAAKQQIEELQEKIARLEAENNELREQISAFQSATQPVNDNTTEPVNDNTTESANDNEGPTIVKLNEAFTVGDVMTITLSSSEWCDDILPSNTSGVYSYYKGNDGEIYFVIRGELKNLSSSTVDITYAGEAEMLINGKYKMAMRYELEEADGTSFYGDVKPLQTLPLIIYAVVSDELHEACETIQVTMDICNDDEMLGYYYNDDTPHDSFVISFEN